MNDFKKDFDDILGDLVKLSDSVTYVCFVMDHSGSMGSHSENSKSNFNEYLKTLKRETDEKMQTLVSVIEFDDRIKIAIENKLISEVKDLDTYWIGGTTALYDAIGRGISVIKQLMDVDPRENKAALMLIQTDGFENASKDYNYGQLKKAIKELEDTKKWTFTFLSEGIEKERASFADLSSFYVNNSISFEKSAQGYSYSADETSEGLKNFYNNRKMGIRSVTNFYNNTGNMTIKDDNGSITISQTKEKKKK